jgi:hypothetical protein
MQMAFMQQGGIKDDGMQVDPVSGNEIPPGSMASEVRDDIPAMLSEGEYVVPADVLRYYGVNFFEGLRNKAKQGLGTMEQNGRIGGEPLTPQQIQQNMSGAPQAGQPAPMPVQANEGVLAQPQQMSQNFNPMNYGTVGFSTMQPAAQQQESVTTFKTWVHAQTGETKVIQYIDGNPTTDEPESPPFYEFGSAALKKAQNQITENVGRDDDPTKTETETETEPDTSWMDGIDFNDAKSVGDSAKSILGLSTGEKAAMGVAGAVAGLPGLAAGKTAVDAMSIAQARALEQYARTDLKDETLANEIQAGIDKALEENKVLGWLDKTFPNLMPGTEKYNQVKYSSTKQLAKKDETAAILQGGGATGDDDGPTVFAGEGAPSRDDPSVTGDRYEFDTDLTTAAEEAENDAIFDAIDEQFEAAGVQQNKGGLMARKKSKNKK